MTIERIEILAVNESFTLEEKREICDAMAEAGLEFKPRKSCPNCYHDALVRLYNAQKPTEEVVQTEPACDYILKDGVDVKMLGKRINAMTITNELGAWAVAHGLPKVFFKSLPQ